MGLGDLSQNALQIAKYREFLSGTSTCTTAATSPSTPAEFRSFRRVTPPTATRSTPAPSSMPSLGEQQQELTTSSGDQDSTMLFDGMLPAPRTSSNAHFCHTHAPEFLTCVSLVPHTGDDLMMMVEAM